MSFSVCSPSLRVIISRTLQILFFWNVFTIIVKGSFSSLLKRRLVLREAKKLLKLTYPVGRGYRWMCKCSAPWFPFLTTVSKSGLCWVLVRQEKMNQCFLMGASQSVYGVSTAHRVFHKGDVAGEPLRR